MSRIDFSNENIVLSIRAIFLTMGLIFFAVSCGTDSPPQTRIGPFPDPPPLTLSHSLGAPDTDSLVGQTWQVGSVNFSFQRGYHALVRGGRLTHSMPTGAPGTYEHEGGIITLEVLGRIYTGVAENGTLTMNERPATYLGETRTIFPESVVHYSTQPEEEPSDDPETI